MKRQGKKEKKSPKSIHRESKKTWVTVLYILCIIILISINVFCISRLVTILNKMDLSNKPNIIIQIATMIESFGFNTIPDVSVVDLVTVATILLLIVQLFMLKRSNINTKKSFDQTNTQEITKFYMNVIIPRMDFFDKVFAQSEKYNKVVELIRSSNYLIYEFNEADLKLIGKVIDDDNFQNLTTEKYYFSSFISNEFFKKYNYDYLKTILSCAFNVPYNNNIMSDNDALKTFLVFELEKMLDNIEYFSTVLFYNKSCNKLCYSSIHRNFIQTVEKLHFFICKNNGEYKEYYQPNTILLYKNWKKRNGEEIRLRKLNKSSLLYRWLNRNNTFDLLKIIMISFIPMFLFSIYAAYNSEFFMNSTFGLLIYIIYVFILIFSYCIYLIFQ